jgi:serine/threonine protein kinase
MMTTLRHCPQCGVELPADAPDGVCPTCLMQQGFDSRADSADDEPGSTGSASRAGFVAPSPEELSARFPQFDIVELVGQGGMGAVYKARQQTLDRFVALKILPPETGNDPAFAERFKREARALAMLSHSSIVSVHDFGEADGLYYLVMEYVDGANLRQTIAHGGLTPREALAIVPQICDALQFAHDAGVVHRDIKPENVLIDTRGRVKITDFGLAKLLGTDTDDTAIGKPFTLTGTRQIMGTAHYMAPEQMQGTSSVDHRADIYSLGVVFYEMLTGELPIGRFEPPSKKVNIDVRLDDVVLRSLEAAPDRRYQHASEVKTEVETIVNDDTVRHDAPPDTPGIRSSAGDRLKMPALGLLVASALDALATLVILLVSLRLPTSQSDALTIRTMVFSAVGVASLVHGVVLALGAAKMFGLRSYRIAVAAAVVAILPFGPSSPISLPFGIWALILLARGDVQAAFDGGSKRDRR